MQCVEVAREPTKAQPRHPRSEIRRSVPGQDEEPRVVGNQVKAHKLLLGQPPDPAVAGLELERPGVPADEREPPLAEHCDVAHASPDQSPEGQIVVRAHQRIPLEPLVGAHRGAHRDLAQPSSNRLDHRLHRRRWACPLLWPPRRRLFSDPVPPAPSISYQPRKIGPGEFAGDGADRARALDPDLARKNWPRRIRRGWPIARGRDESADPQEKLALANSLGMAHGSQRVATEVRGRKNWPWRIRWGWVPAESAGTARGPRRKNWPWRIRWGWRTVAGGWILARDGAVCERSCDRAWPAFDRRPVRIS